MSCNWDDIWFIIGFILFSLAIGIIGFRLFTGHNWYDSICMASLCLGGNHTPAIGTSGLLFVALYSLYGTLIFYVIATIVVDKVFWNYLGIDKGKPVPPLRPQN